MSTSIEQLRSVKNTWEFKAPNFINNVELVVELKQPEILTMMLDGTITNPLLNDVNKLINAQEDGKKMSAKDQATVFSFIKKVVRFCMVSPTYEEVEQYAGGLSQVQLIAIYEEVMRTVTSLSSFRTE